MKITFIAQSGFIIETPQMSFSIDLWLDNPLHKISLDDVPKLDAVFITHDHFDHGLMDGVELAKRDDAFFISSKDIQDEILKEAGLKFVEPPQIGEVYTVNDLSIKLMHAKHPSEVGEAIGFLITIDGTKIYHPGDTDYIDEFEDIGKNDTIDLFLVPIGSYYTMGPSDAVRAVKAVNPKHVIPMHYNTFDKIKQDPMEFAEEVKTSSNKTKIHVLDPGTTLIF